MRGKEGGGREESETDGEMERGKGLREGEMEIG